MKTAKNYLMWIVFNGAFALAIYFGYVEGVNGAENIASFVVAYAFIISLFSLHDDVIKKVRKAMSTAGKRMPYVVDVTFDILVTIVFAWHGCWWLTAFYAVHILFLYIIRQKVNKEILDECDLEFFERS